MALEEGGEFTEFGYVRDTGDTFYEVYDGDRENIPGGIPHDELPGRRFGTVRK